MACCQQIEVKGYSDRVQAFVGGKEEQKRFRIMLNVCSFLLLRLAELVFLLAGKMFSRSSCLPLLVKDRTNRSTTLLNPSLRRGRIRGM